MDVTSADVTSAGAASAASGAAAPASGRDGPSFHDILSALNPLQYLPVVGTIYRAVTGDTVSEPMRVMGSLAASAIMGGPVGMLINLGTTAVEKLAGIDPDQIAHRVLASIGLADPDPVSGPGPAPPPTLTASAVEPAARVVMEAGDASDAARMRQAADAYGKAQALIA